MDEDRRKSDAVDEFWNIDSLVPKKRSPSVFEKSHTEPIEIEIPSAGTEPSGEKNTEKIPEGGVIKRYIHPHTAQSERAPLPDESYIPEKSLIHSVRLYSWSSSYPYYEPFRRSAVYYYNKTSPRVAEIPYFSYMPQYSQLNDAQLAFFLWIRSEIREGRYPLADYSYLLLLIYETINLSDKVPADRSVDLLVRIWLNYRDEYPRLDVQLSEWIFDMCLIWKLPPPSDCLRTVGKTLPPTAGLREFYADAIGDSDAFAELLMSYCANYDYRKSKFAVGDNLPVYEKHMKGVISYIISRCSDPAHPFELSGFKMQDSKTKRDAYTGALCSPKVKKRIEFDYCSFSHSHELRFVVTDILKYAENRIRAHLGIKSRLSVNSLSDEIKALANEYFDECLPVSSKTPHTEDESPAYEKFYEPNSSGLSFESASKIEELSWETTERFIDAFETQEEAAPLPVIAENITQSSEPAYDGNSYENFKEYEMEFIRAALNGDYEAQLHIANKQSSLPDLIADSINTAAADILGDILLEEAECGYAVIEDYRDDALDAVNSYFDKR